MRALPRRPVVLVARSAVLAAMAAGCLGYSLADKTVTIAADGQTRTLHTFGGSVASALHRAGLTVGPHDVVAPGLGVALHDGSRIVVARGRQLSLTLDGVQKTLWTTQADLADAVDSLGLRLDGAYVSASRSRSIPMSGLSLTVRLPQRVSLVVGGRASTVTTTAATVAQLLTEQGVALGPYDVLSTSLDSYPTSATTVSVTRVARLQWLQRNKIGIPTVKVADSHLTVGKIQLAHDGKTGMHYRLWGIEKDDGTVVLRKLLQERVVAAKPRVLHYGTKPKPVVLQAAVAAPVVQHTTATTRPATSTSTAATPTTSKGAGLNWAALAQCESGGNPHLIDGGYYGLYQFSLGTWQSVGGTGRPSDASSAEQTYRAKLLYAQQGRSPWPSCGHNL
ncbi:MAG: resuscitation-promoting factor RpfB [Frankiales bacterium]|nr:resuscitation-promoting factor RpfB [Frankiales bacterium]